MKTTTETVKEIPDYLGNQLQSGFKQFGEAQKTFPTISEIPGQTPLLDIPNLTPEQQQLIQQMIQAGSTTSPNMQAAQQQLAMLTQGPIGSSPYTQDAMQAFQQFEVPKLLQSAALAGRGTGGAALEAQSMGAQQAMLPLLQQEIENKKWGVGEYAGLQQQQTQQLAAALEASGLSREVAQQQAQAAYEQAQQRLQFESGIQTLPLGLIPNLIGQKTTEHGTMTWEDWVGGIGKSLSASGILGKA